MKQPDRPGLLLIGTVDAYWRQLLVETAGAYMSITALNFEDALVALQQQPYVLTILDAGAVGRVGAAISQIKALQPRMIVLVVTASPTWTRAREAFRAGAVDYVRKPNQRDELDDLVRTALNAARPAGAGI